MEIFNSILYHPYFYLAQSAFMVWMLVDAYRRRADYYWYWIILFLPGIGSLVYFFAVKLADFNSPRLSGLFHRPVPLQELRYRVETAPTLTNQLALAERLIELREFDEAAPLLEGVLKREPDHATALYSLALCRKEQGLSDEAITLLEKLVARDSRWSNYKAWQLLIECRALVGDRPAALASCRELVRLAPFLPHQYLLAEHLVAAGQTDEARTLLDRALQDYSFAPGYVRRRDRRWASQARSLQKQVNGKG